MKLQFIDGIKDFPFKITEKVKTLSTQEKKVAALFGAFVCLIGLSIFLYKKLSFKATFIPLKKDNDPTILKNTTEVREKEAVIEEPSTPTSERLSGHSDESQPAFRQLQVKFKVNGNFYFAGLQIGNEVRISAQSLNGNGEILFEGGKKWKGNFVNSLPDGDNCEYTDEEGTKYVGSFSKGNFLEGTKTFTNGEIHTGKFVKGRMTGTGKIETPEAIFLGEFANYRLVSGIHTDKNTGIVTEGEFENNKPVRIISKVDKDGELLEGIRALEGGKIVAGKLEGKGVKIEFRKDKNGNKVKIYSKGDFKNNRLVEGSKRIDSDKKWQLEEGAFDEKGRLHSGEGGKECCRQKKDGSYVKGIFVSGVPNGLMEVKEKDKNPYKLNYIDGKAIIPAKKAS